MILCFLPESPKFVLSQGKQAEAYAILEQMNRINNGKDSELEKFIIYEESESIENRQLIAQTKNSRFPILSTVWLQTVPLFKKPHSFSTVLICVIQFCIFLPAGCIIFSASILNTMSANLDDFINQRAMMCEVINMKVDTISATNEDVSIYISSFYLEYLVILCGCYIAHSPMF